MTDGGPEWMDLADDELVARLVQRGWDRDRAMTAAREWDVNVDWALRIQETLS